MHSPAPMQNGASYGMPMNNYGNLNNNSGVPIQNMAPQQQVGMLRGPPQQMMNNDDLMNNNAGYMGGGNFNGMQQIPQPQQNNFNMMPNGLNTHGNMMSPHQPPPPQIQSQIMMQQQPASSGIMSPQLQQPTNQMIYNNQQQQPPIASQQMMSPHGMPSPHNQQQGIMPQYPQPGISPLPNQQPQHQIIQHVQNQMLPNNPQSRVMSPLQQQQQQPNGGMMSPHHQMMTQQAPQPSMRGPIPPPQHLQQGNGSNIIQNRMANNMMPPQHIQPPPQSHVNMQQNPQMIVNQQSGVMGPPPSNMQHKMYQNSPIIFNSQNPNAPPIYICGACHREVNGEADEGIMCESGCNYWFHRLCIGLSQDAYMLLKNELYAEWICANCEAMRPPLVKFKS